MFIKIGNKILNKSRIDRVIECDGEVRVYMIGFDFDNFYSFHEINIDEIYNLLKQDDLKWANKLAKK